MAAPYAGMEERCPRCKGGNTCHSPDCQGGLVLTDAGKEFQDFVERCIDRYRQREPEAFGLEE